MTDGHFCTWSFLMDFKILLLILQISSLVHTGKNTTTVNENLVDEPIFTSATGEITSSSTIEVGTKDVSNTTNSVLSDEPEFRITDNELNDEKNFVTEIYEKIDGLKTGNEDENESPTTTVEQFHASEQENITANLHQIDEFDKNTLVERKQTNSSTLSTSSLLTPTYHQNSLNLSSTTVSIHNESDPYDSSMTNDSQSLLNSIFHSFINSIWTSFYKPLFKIIALKMTSNLSDKTQNVRKSSFEMQNSTVTRILTNVYTNLSTTLSSNSRIYDVSEAVESTTTTVHPITSMTNVLKSPSKNDSLILEIDTIISSTAVTKANEQSEQRNNDDKLKNEIIEKLFNAKNNSLNDDAVLMFMKIIIQNYNNSKIRRPFSSRYSGLQNFTSDMRQKLKREIPFDNEYNSADRQELASYFYNDQKIRENYLNYAKPSNQDVSPNQYNTDKIDDRPEFDPYSGEAIYLRNGDNPTMEYSDESQKFNSNIAPNFHTDLNDSSLLYLVDSLGYSIFNDDGLKSTTTEMSIEHEPTYSKNKWSKTRAAGHPKKRISTRKKSRKNIAYRRRPDSIRQKKNTTPKTSKVRSNRMKLSMKSVGKKHGRKNNSSSSTYLRLHSKYRRRTNKQDIKNKKRRALSRRTSSRRKSRQNRKRTKQSTRSRSA